MYNAGLIDDQQWKAFIEDDISFTLGNDFAQAVWTTFKAFFEPELVEYVDGLLPTVDASNSYQYWFDTVESLSTETQSDQ